eukprot:scaffold7340_cov266-Pinguiococcus_pyrenoidosus.AAC.25
MDLGLVRTRNDVSDLSKGIGDWKLEIGNWRFEGILISVRCSHSRGAWGAWRLAAAGIEIVLFPQ